jgi:hypothetical protein
VTTHPRTPDGDPPSDGVRPRFAAELHDQLASSRLAWEAALLRSDAALAAGDPAEIEAALEEQRAVLAELERRVLGSVAAIAAPDGSAPGGGTSHPAPSSEGGATPVEPDGARPDGARPDGARRERRAPALSGAFAGLALVAGLWSIGPTVSTGAPDEAVVAAGEVTAADTVQELRTAASDVVGRPLVIADVAGPPRELARFSASLPPTATRGAPPAEPEAPSTPAVATGVEDEATTEVVEAPTEPAPAIAASTGEPEEPVDPVDALAPDLPAEEEDEPDDVAVPSRAPASLVELTDEVRRILEPPLASDPTPGLR